MRKRKQISAMIVENLGELIRDQLYPQISEFTIKPISKYHSFIFDNLRLRLRCNLFDELRVNILDEVGDYILEMKEFK